MALGGEPGTDRAAETAEPANVQVAKLDDKAPSGSYERAPAGALADRDYSHTALDPEKARALINQYRKEKGLKPLAAQRRAHRRRQGALARPRQVGPHLPLRVGRLQSRGTASSAPAIHARLAAENVGTGQIDFQEVLRGWKESSGHNKNLLLSDATHMGIALVQDPKTEFKSFWTLVIGASM